MCSISKLCIILSLKTNPTTAREPLFGHQRRLMLKSPALCLDKKTHKINKYKVPHSCTDPIKGQPKALISTQDLLSVFSTMRRESEVEKNTHTSEQKCRRGRQKNRPDKSITSAVTSAPTALKHAVLLLWHRNSCYKGRQWQRWRGVDRGWSCCEWRGTG